MKTRYKTRDAVGVIDLCKTKATTFCGNVNFNEKTQTWEFLHRDANALIYFFHFAINSQV